MYHKIITMVTYQRPEYTRQVLEGIKNCVGSENYTVLIHAEPGFSNVIDVINSMKEHLNINLTVNGRTLGADQNVFNVLEHGFSWSDYVILLEDDDMPAKDCLKYFEWARDTYAEDKTVMTVTSYERAGCEPVDYYSVFKNHWFTPWGWATWKDRWDEIRPKWFHPLGWDSAVLDTFGPNRHQIKPKLSRTQNIGAENSVHVPNAQWHRENHYNDFWVGSVELGEGVYHEV
jgi:hypothetical protein